MTGFRTVPSIAPQLQSPVTQLNGDYKPLLNSIDDVHAADFTGGNVTLTLAQAQAGTVTCTGASAPRNLIFPHGYTGQRTVVNSSGQVITVKTDASGTTVAVADGATVDVVISGNDVTVKTAVSNVSVTAPITNSGTSTAPVVGISAATSGAAGSMSAADKAKLDAAASANTGTTLVERDAAGRAQFTDPSAAQDAATKAYVDLLVTGVLKFQGSTDCSANPNYPAAVKGDSYVVSVAGKIGGASGTVVNVGDMYFAIADNAGGTEASVGASWDKLDHLLVGAALLAANNVFTGTNEFDSQFWSKAYACTDAPNITVDWNNGNVQYVIINGNRTLDFSNAKQGGIYTLIVIQGAGGGYSLGYAPSPDAWIGGAGTPSIASGAVNIFTYWHANSKFFGQLVTSDPAVNRSNLGVAIGSDVQAYSAKLAAIAALTWAANKIIYVTGASTAAIQDFTALAQALLACTTQGDMQNAIGLILGTTVQAWDADLDALAALATNGLVKRTGAGTAAIVAAPSGAVVGDTDVQTLSGKRIARRVVVVNVPGATPSINTDNTDLAAFTGLNAAITSMTTNLSGTPVAGDELIIEFTDDGTGRAITWGSGFENGAATLPTTTVASTLLIAKFYRNTTTSKWRCMASG